MPLSQTPGDNLQSQARPSGFTLVELLVVIAIIGVLIALLLPAVQAARESARRTQCQNNLKQIGLALHNYHSARKRFPPAGTDYGWCKYPENGGARTIRNGNGLLELLPYLEQQVIYDQFDFDHAASNTTEGNNQCCPPTTSLGTLLGDADASGNTELATNQLSVFLCPSDMGEISLESEGSPGAKTNYDFSTSNIYRCDYWSRTPPDKQQMFGENSNTRTSFVTDGLSNTIAMAETMRDIFNGRAAAWGYRTWVTPGVDIAGHEINRWQWPGVIDTPRRTQLASWGHPGSLHDGGVYVLMADGSAHFMAEDTDQQVRQRMAAMADDQVTTSP